jgi:hypothetical protein
MSKKSWGVTISRVWLNTSDYMCTSEGLGMIAIPLDDLASAVEQIQLPADYTIKKLTNGQRYLCKTMNTKLPFLSVDGEEEYRLFEKLVLLVSPCLDFDKMAIKWCNYVDGNEIFQKLPVYLRTHHMLWSRNQRVQDAVKNARNGEIALRVINDSTAPKMTLQLAHAPTPEPEPTPAPTTASVPTTDQTIESRDWSKPTMPPTMQQAPVSMQMQQNINMTIVAGLVIGGAPVAATATPKLREKEKKERKKCSYNNCLANGKGMDVAKMCATATPQLRGKDMKERKKRSCNNCLAHEKGMDVAQMCKVAQARGRCPLAATYIAEVK